MKRSLILLLILSLAAPVLFLGCSGDDGATGASGISTLALVTNEPAGANCADGGQKLTTGVDDNRNGILDPAEVDSTQYVCNGESGTAAANLESCAICHQAEPFVSVAATHAAARIEEGFVPGDVVAVSSVVATPGASLTVTFNVKVNGANRNDLNLYRAYVNWQDSPSNPPFDNVSRFYVTTFRRTTITDNVLASFASTGNGGYTVTVPTAVQTASGPNATYLFILTDNTAGSRGVIMPTVAVTDPAGVRVLRNLVSDTGCASCHGPYPAWRERFDHYQVGGSNCQICHSREDRNVEAISKDAQGNFTTTGPLAWGTNIVEYVHGIHNSHNRVSQYRGTGAYYRSPVADDLANTEDRWSIGYPSSMLNCNVCHETEAQINAAASAPPSWHLCMSCHENWDGFKRHVDGSPVFPTGNFHRSVPTTKKCTDCHAGVASIDEAGDFHTIFHLDLSKPDAHDDQFYRGKDTSFDNPNDVAFQIGDITKSGNSVSFKWTATKNGAAVNPCNDNIAAGPLFNYPSSSGVAREGGLGAYLAYAKGDDWVNENISTSPGQPSNARNLFSSLSTTCAGNVATTTGLTIASGTEYAGKALLAIGGKPIDQSTFNIAGSSVAKPFFVRVPSPTKAFSMTDGTAVPVAQRRGSVDTSKCNGCHRGTLYQHGGDRVDNEQLCVICHNPASNEKNNRKETTGSGSSQRYGIVKSDGTVDTSKTYDGKEGETFDMRYMIHSIHGVEQRGTPYVVYRTRGIFAFVPPLYSQVGDDWFEEYFPPPTGWPLVDGIPEPAVSGTVYGATTHTTQTHNWTLIHYPKQASECTACHNAGLYEPPDQTKAVGVTIDPGNNYTVHTDDILIGPAAAACTACHNEPAVKGHAASFGYRANVTRDEMLLLAGP